MQALDTSTLPRSERADAMITHLREIALASRVVLEHPARAFMSTQVYALGEVQLLHLERSGLFIDVSRERDDGPPVVAMMLGSRSAATRLQFGHVIRQRPGAVDMIELHRPHTTWGPGSRDGWCLKVPSQALGLPAGVITRARPALGASPLQRIYARHLAMLTELVPDLTQPAAGAADLGAATIAMTRAVLSAAAGDDPALRESLHASLVPRVQVFVREHLRDPRLSAQTIAAAHHISVRLLYRVLADAGIHLEQWVIEQRLDGARRELASPAGRRLTIAAVAHRWGFATPSHFSRRFHERYGLTPQEWRHREG